ncbi:MAG: PHP domain-containing protein [Chlamydiota bacterium]|nr:PHP domain-containing protein [Chlamydiota bacterium]
MIEGFQADLHCHTTCSDGTFSPKEVIMAAKAANLQGLSITDHDTITAYETAFSYAEEFGIRLLPGVEFSTIHKGQSIHVLAYAFSSSHRGIQEFCKEHHERRRVRMFQMIDLLGKQGIKLSADEVFEDANSIGRPHLAKVLIRKGIVKNLKEAFQEYLGDGKSCFVPSNTVSTEETIAIIREANAFAVIAHPHLIKQQEIVLDLLKLDFDGLEGYYARFQPHQERVWIKIAQERGWMITGGSDFHGSIKPQIPLGCSWVGESTFKVLYDRYQENLNG